MRDRPASQLLSMLVHILGDIEADHDPNLIGHQHHIPMAAIGIEESLEKRTPRKIFGLLARDFAFVGAGVDVVEDPFAGNRGDLGALF